MLSKLHILTWMLKMMMKILNLKFVIKLEYLNMIRFFAKDYTPTWSEDVFIIGKNKNTLP